MEFSAINDIGRYYHTLKSVKPEQALWWAWYRLYRPRPDLAPAPPLWPTSVKWTETAARPDCMTAPDACRFMGRERSIASPGCWNDPTCDKRWLYNLHYFDNLNAQGAEDRLEWHRDLIHRWIEENPAGRGVGWEPYPTALRIVNWIKWGLSGNGLHAKWRHSLAVQARWLTKRLERHLGGNRLFAEAKALVFAGLFFEDKEPRRWLDQGLILLAREIPAQVLPDGGHITRSPAGHALALEDLLDLINLARTYANALPEEHRGFVETWPEIAAVMRRNLALMCHPDGDIAFFNDAALDVAPRRADLERYAGRLGLAAVEADPGGLTHLGDAGYIRMTHQDAVALLDVAPVGPEYLPGHAHADTLSFELSLYGRRVLVNSGTSEYDATSERRRQRGTPAHNTVTVNDMDSSQVWGGNRVGRPAKPFGLWVESRGRTMKVSCSHDGYHRLAGRPVHRRRWHFTPGQLKITDTVEGHFQSARARFHFHPEVEILKEAGGLSAKLGDGRRLDIAIDGGTGRLEPATWHPAFGKSVPNQCLEIVFQSDKLETVFTWQQVQAMEIEAGSYWADEQHREGRGNGQAVSGSRDLFHRRLPLDFNRLIP